VSSLDITGLKTVAVCLAALLLGGLVAFFTAGPALFADGGFSERVVVLSVSVVFFALLGLLLGALAPEAWRLVALCAWLPLLGVLVVLGAESLSQWDTALLLVGFALGDAAAVFAGSLLGARLRLRGSSGSTT
jgi:CDP-diglyceride synthetase